MSELIQLFSKNKVKFTFEAYNFTPNLSINRKPMQQCPFRRTTSMALLHCATHGTNKVQTSWQFNHVERLLCNCVCNIGGPRSNIIFFCSCIVMHTYLNMDSYLSCNVQRIMKCVQRYLAKMHSSFFCCCCFFVLFSVSIWYRGSTFMFTVDVSYKNAVYLVKEFMKLNYTKPFCFLSNHRWQYSKNERT